MALSLMSELDKAPAVAPAPAPVDPNNITLEQKQAVIKTLLDRGEKLPELKKRIEALGENQNAFFANAIDKLGLAPAAGGARGAFERGEPTAALEPDTGPNAGKRIPAVTTTASQSLNYGMIKGAMPTEGLQAKLAQAGGLAANKEDFKRKKAAVENQGPLNTGLTAIGEIYGMILGGEVFGKMIGQGFEAAGAVGKALPAVTDPIKARLGQIADTLSTHGVELSQKAASKLEKMFGSEWNLKLGRILRDSGVTSIPSRIGTIADKLKVLKDYTGARVTALWERLTSAAGPTAALTKNDLITVVNSRFAKAAADAGVDVSGSVTDKAAEIIRDSLKAVPDDALLNPLRLAKEASKLERQADKFAKLGGENEHAADVMVDVAGAIRSYLADIAETTSKTVKGVSTLAADLKEANKDYAFFRTAWSAARKGAIAAQRQGSAGSLIGPGVAATAKNIVKVGVRSAVGPAANLAARGAEVSAEGAQMAKELLALGPKLGPYAKRLAAAAEIGVNAVLNLHSALVVNDRRYLELLMKVEEPGAMTPSEPLMKL